MMRPSAAQLPDLRAIHEQPSVEAKRSSARTPARPLSAFSNEPGLGGGILLLGVACVDGRYELVGVAAPDRVSSDISRACAGDKCNRRLRLTMRSNVVQGKAVVGVAVSEARPDDEATYSVKVP